MSVSRPGCVSRSLSAGLTWIIVGVAILTPQLSARESTDSKVARAREVLESSARVYQQLPALKGRLNLIFEAPHADLSAAKHFDYALGEDGDVMMNDTFLRLAKVGNRILVAKLDVPDRYLELPFEGSYVEGLTRVFGDKVPAPELVQMAMRSGGGVDRIVDSLGLKILANLRIASYALRDGDNGSSWHEIELTADNGSVIFRLDGEQTWPVDSISSRGRSGSVSP